jgi:hypothetical protein
MSNDIIDLVTGDVISCEILSANVPFYHYMLMSDDNTIYEFGADTRSSDNALSSYSVRMLRSSSTSTELSYKLVLDEYIKANKTCKKFRHPIIDTYLKYLAEYKIYHKSLMQSKGLGETSPIKLSKYSNTAMSKANRRFQYYIDGIVARIKKVSSFVYCNQPLQYNILACNCQTVLDYVLLHYTVPSSYCTLYDGSEVLKTRSSDDNFYIFILSEMKDKLFSEEYVQWLDEPKYYTFDSDVLTASNVRCLNFIGEMECIL